MLKKRSMRKCTQSTGSRQGSGDQEQAVRSKSHGPVRRPHDRAAFYPTDDSECIGAPGKRFAAAKSSLTITNEGTWYATKTVRWAGTCSTKDSREAADLPAHLRQMADFDVVFVRMDNARPRVKRASRFGTPLERHGRRIRWETTCRSSNLCLQRGQLTRFTNLNDLCFFRVATRSSFQSTEREIEPETLRCQQGRSFGTIDCGAIPCIP